MTRIRKLLAFLLVLLLMASEAPAFALPNEDLLIKKGDDGDNVILLQLRLRDLGYYNYKITGFFGDFTATAVKDFQKENGIKADGVAGSKTLDPLYSNSAKRKPVKPRILPKPSPRKKNTAGSSRYGKLRDWFDYVNNRMRYKTKYKVVDFDTGLSYYVIRVGGQKHADVEPATAADTKVMYKTLGNSWDNWERRALIVYINNEAIAASLYGEPHGKETVPNNGMNGQVCIHFLNSKTHGSNHVDPGHQRQIRRAAGR